MNGTAIMAGSKPLSSPLWTARLDQPSEARARGLRLHATGDTRVRRMVVNRFEIFSLHGKPVEALISHEACRQASHQVLDESWPITGTLRHVFFIRAFE